MITFLILAAILGLLFGAAYPACMAVIWLAAYRNKITFKEFMREV